MSDNEFTTLTVDVGNSFVKMAIFQGEELVEFIKQDQLEAEGLQELCKEHAINGIAYSASGDDSEDVLKFIESYKNHIFLTSQVNMPINIKYKTPLTLGKDRIAAVLGARSIFPNENVLIVDLGTCITYELLTKDGDYLGGNIAPGVEMRLQAMHEFTDRLPLVDVTGDDHWIGNTTESAMRNGAVLGTQLEIESFISRTKAYFDGFQIIFTGGGAKYLFDKINEEITLDPYLIHRGLLEILKYNDDKN